jgi:TRAP-type C4-dicarboxylate transport system substrate-binding protein
MAKLNEEIQKVIDNASEVLYREEIYINSRHEYDYHKLEATRNVTVHTLYFSEDEEWAENMRKQVAMQLVDNGDGVEIIGACTKKHLDYLEAEQLHILLRLSSTHCVYQIAEPAPKKEF